MALFLPTDAFLCWCFIQLAKTGKEATILPVTGLQGVYACFTGDCGCLFYPDTDGGCTKEVDYIWVDRYQQAIRDPDGSVTGCQAPDCPCHELVHLADDNRDSLAIDFVVEPTSVPS